MENNQERVLAYTLAKEISNQELIAVSGGAAWNTGHSTTGMTGGGSASSGQGGEAHVDATWDF
jgi:hypothetical protein